jgi:membrane protein implicated in regulation of membrane protease activity
MDFLASGGLWGWWTIAVVLLILELMAPGVAFIWLALAAAAMGGLAWIAPGIPWQVEAILYAIATVAILFIVKPWLRQEQPGPGDALHLNRRQDSYVGRTFDLPAAIENGEGHLIIDDTRWRVRGPNLERGERVKVTGVDGLVLVVDKA